MSWTVIQRKRMTQDERDLAEYFDPMTEEEARELARRLAGYDSIRCAYPNRGAAGMLKPEQLAIIDRMRWLVEHGWPRRTIASIVADGER